MNQHEHVSGKDSANHQMHVLSATTSQDIHKGTATCEAVVAMSPPSSGPSGHISRSCWHGPSVTTCSQSHLNLKSPLLAHAAHALVLSHTIYIYRANWPSCCVPLILQENAVVCDVGIASYTKFENGTWVDAGKVDDTSQGSHFGGGGCQV